MALNGIPIDENDCIGDSLDTINNAFSTLDNNVAGINVNLAEVKSRVDKIVLDQNYVGAWIKSPVATGAPEYNGTFLFYDSASNRWYHNPNIISKIDTSTVGIGTSSPVAKLHVNSTASNTPALIVDSTDSLASMEVRGAAGGSIDFKKNGSALDYIVRLQSEGSGDINGGGALKVLGNYFDIAAGTSTSTVSSMLRISNSSGGRIGIGGITSPLAKLDIGGNAGADGGEIRLRGGSTNLCDYTLDSTGDSFKIYKYTKGATTGAVEYLSFSTNGDVSLKDIFIKDSTNRVGIGTSTPLETLHVQGNALINGTLSLSGGIPTDLVANVVEAVNLSGTYLHLKHAGSLNDWALIRQIGGANNYHLAVDLHDDSIGGAFAGQTFSIRNVASTGSGADTITPLIHAAAVGGEGGEVRVGINTSSPQATLDVNGELFLGRQSTSEEGGEIQFARASDNTPSLFIDSLGSGANPRLRVYSRPTGTAGSELFTALSATNGARVGINIASPQATLHVNGTTITSILSVDSIFVKNSIISETDVSSINNLLLQTLTVQDNTELSNLTVKNTNTFGSIENHGSGGSYIDLGFSSNTLDDYGLRVACFNNNYNSGFTHLHSRKDLRIYTSGSPGAGVFNTTFTSTGKVGIGTNSPDFNLHVAGTVGATGKINALGSVGGIAVDGGGSGGILEQQSAGTGNSGNAAYMTFHRPNSHAVKFGLDTDNQLKVGGWSMGNIAYRIVHEGLTGTTLKDSLYVNSTDAANIELLGTNGAYIDLRRDVGGDYALRFAHFPSENSINSKGVFRIYTGPDPSGSPLQYRNPTGLTILEGIPGSRGGYVGVNTATPTSQFHVEGNTLVNGVLTVGRQDTSQEGGQIYLARASDNNQNGIALDCQGSNNALRFRAFTDGKGELFTAGWNESGNTPVPRFGIGTSTPETTLDVKGIIQTNSSIRLMSQDNQGQYYPIHLKDSSVTAYYELKQPAQLNLNYVSAELAADRRFRHTVVYNGKAEVDGKSGKIMTLSGNDPRNRVIIHGQIYIEDEYGNIVPLEDRVGGGSGGGVPTGTVVYFARQTPPAGFLVCDGSPYTKTGQTSALYAAIQDTFANTGGLPPPASTHFRVPDLRGEFIRGWSSSRPVSGDANRGFGTSQLDAMQTHIHRGEGGNINQTRAYRDDGGSSNNGYANTGPPLAPARIADETRPRNVALLPCIKFSEVSEPRFNFNWNDFLGKTEAANTYATKTYVDDKFDSIESVTFYRMSMDDKIETFIDNVQVINYGAGRGSDRLYYIKYLTSENRYGSRFSTYSAPTTYSYGSRVSIKAGRSTTMSFVINNDGGKSRYWKFVASDSYISVTTTKGKTFRKNMGDTINGGPSGPITLKANENLPTYWIAIDINASNSADVITLMQSSNDSENWI